MATIRTRRMMKERENLEKETTDYVCFFPDDNMFRYFCYLTAPEDSVYCHKLLKLEFEIPDRYPIVPPKVKFIQHQGMRIHPNLYVEGKLCLSILGTWPGEPWALSMTTDGVLRTVQSLLDNQPYTHEPGQQHHPEYSEFVRYTTWRWLLLDYLEKETHPGAKAWLQKYVAKKGDKMMEELLRQQALPGPLPARTTRKAVSARPYNHKEVAVDYPLLIQQLQSAIQSSKAAQHPVVSVNDKLDDASAPPESSPENPPTCPTKKMKTTDITGIVPGGSSKARTTAKRKITAEYQMHSSQTATQAMALAGQQAKAPTEQSEPSSKRIKKKNVEVIDLT